MDPEFATQHEVIAGHIRDYGWHCLHVWPDEEGQDAFSYSIGFTASFGAPEVIVFDMPRDKAHALLSACAGLLRAGHVIRADVEDPGVLNGGYRVVFRPVRPECRGEYLGTAERYYGDRPFEAMVLFLPDRDHRFAWHDGYNGPGADEALAITSADSPASTAPAAS